MQIDFINGLVLLGFVFNLSLSIFLLYRALRLNTSTILYFSAFGFSLSAWCLAMFFYRGVGTIDDSILWAKFLYTSASFSPSIFIIFSSSFIDKKVNKFLEYSILLINIILAFLILTTDSFIFDVTIPETGEKIIDFGSLYFLYTIYIPVGFISSFIILIKKYFEYRKNKKGVERIQILLILIGSFVTSSIAMVTNLNLPTFGYFKLNWFGQVSTILWLSIITYSILKYKLFDIRILIGRIVYISILASILYVSFYFSLLIDHRFFGNSLSIAAMIFGVFFALVYVVVYEFINKYIKEKVTSTFINPGFDPVESVNKLNTEINSILDADNITDTVLTTLAKTIRPNYEGILISRNESLEIKTKKDTCEVEMNKLVGVLTIWKTVGDYPINLDEIEIEVPRKLRNLSNWLDIVVKEMKKAKLKLLIPIPSTAKGEYLGALMLGEKEGDTPYNSVETSFLMDIGDATGAALARSFLHFEVKELNDNLQHKVDDATKELREKVIALEEARRKERDMLDILGHELRTPLTIVRNSINMLKIWAESNSLSKEKLDKYLDMAMDNLIREVKLLETMLTTTKIDNNNLSLTLEKVDLKDVIDNSLHALSEKAHSKGIEIKYKPPTEAFVFADRTRFQEIIDNILDNAIKYTHEGHVKIEVTNVDGMTNIKISDTGVGIPKKDIPKLGQKFYRINTYLESSQRAGVDIVRPGGTGLGLYVVFQLVQAMHGILLVDSDIDKGSIFTIKIPSFTGQEIEDIGEKKESTFEKFKRLKEKKSA